MNRKKICRVTLTYFIFIFSIFEGSIITITHVDIQSEQIKKTQLRKIDFAIDKYHWLCEKSLKHRLK